MADEKKSAVVFGSESDRKTTERITFLLFGLLLLAALVSALLAYLESFGNLGALWKRIVDYFLEHIWPIWKIIAALLSALAIVGIIRNSLKLRTINIEENKIYNPRLADVQTLAGEKAAEPKNERWEKIIQYTNSDHASDWRQAIIEADVMLGELLRTFGYQGESVGDMLKSVGKNDFNTIDDAWEAHKVRNAIAHSGGDFQLNERETKHAIALFEKVFKEFQVI